MYFKLKSKVIFRNFESFGIITDNRNFGYKQNQHEENYIGDKILSESGTIFMSALERKTQTIDELLKRINSQFADIDIRILKEDAIEFYSNLEHDGFLVSGESIQECEEKDIRFSYKKLKSKNRSKSLSSTIVHSQKSTQDFLDGHFNGKPQLTNLHIEIISKCNERCIHCYIPHEDKINHMEPEIFYNILEQCKDLRLLHVTLSGGEPMLHKDFSKYLRKCREYDLSVNVLSNLTLLDDEIINEMKANPLLGVQVSLYSMNSTVHDEVTQMKGSFEKTKKAILKLVKNDIPLQISCPIIKQNKDCYTEVKKWAEKYNIQVGEDYGILARYNHTKQSCRLSINEIREVINEKVATDEKYLEQLGMLVERKKNTSSDDFVCSVCNSSICIADNGNVYPCAGWQDYVVGNIKEASLKDIWNYSERVQYLRELRNRDFAKCIQCEDKEYCSICLVKNANENSKGDPLVVNEFFCNIAKLNRQIVLERKG